MNILLRHIGCALLLCAVASAQAQTSMSQHRVKITAGASWNEAVSSSMRESMTDFRKDLTVDYNNSGYPFQPGEVHTAFGLDVLASYSLQNDHCALILGFSYNFFDTEQAVLSRTAYPAPNDYAHMNISSLSMGGEYSLFKQDADFNVFGRAAVLASLINGSTRTTAILPSDILFTTVTSVPTVGRLGYGLECGLRANLPLLPIGIEFSAQYLNTNLLGKTYEAPSSHPNNDLYVRALNDGANPDNASDKSRTIDLLRIKVGLFIRF